MEFHHHHHNNNDIEMWEWREEDFVLQKDSMLDVTQCLWNDMNPNNNSLLYTWEEHTPTKDCGDFGYNLDLTDKSNEIVEESRESSRSKRRRTLQFTHESNEQIISSTSENSKEFEDSLLADEMLDCLDWNPEWNSSFSDDRSSGGRPINCLTETEMIYSSGEMSSSMNNSVTSDEQTEVSELVKIPSAMEKVTMKKKPNSALCRIFRGRKSFMNTPTKLTTTVAYPFTLVKPCEGQGDVTLNDINQRIHAPRLPRSKPDRGEDPSQSYPTSAFSGKPVVAKTKIRTEGGKGSITIMRTKG